MNRLMKDLAVDRARNPDAALADKWDPTEEEDADDDDDEVNIIDRSKHSVGVISYPHLTVFYLLR